MLQLKADQDNQKISSCVVKPSAKECRLLKLLKSGEYKLPNHATTTTTTTTTTTKQQQQQQQLTIGFFWVIRVPGNDFVCLFICLSMRQEASQPVI